MSYLPSDIQAVTNHGSVASQAQLNQPGLRMVHYTDHATAQTICNDGLPFGTNLGSQDLFGIVAPLRSALNHGTLEYFADIQPEEAVIANLHTLAGRKVIGNTSTNSIVIISFPDSPKRYEEIRSIMSDDSHSDTYSKSDIYVVLTLQWINYFIDFDSNGDQIIPPCFIAGYINLDNVTFTPNTHFGEPFEQSSVAKQKLPVN